MATQNGNVQSNNDSAAKPKRGRKPREFTHVTLENVSIDQMRGKSFLTGNKPKDRAMIALELANGYTPDIKKCNGGSAIVRINKTGHCVGAFVSI